MDSPADQWEQRYNDEDYGAVEDAISTLRGLAWQPCDDVTACMLRLLSAPSRDRLLAVCREIYLDEVRARIERRLAGIASHVEVDAVEWRVADMDDAHIRVRAHLTEDRLPDAIRAINYDRDIVIDNLHIQLLPVTQTGELDPIPLYITREEYDATAGVS